jgi:hypothetical protein
MVLETDASNEQLTRTIVARRRRLESPTDMILEPSMHQS